MDVRLTVLRNKTRELGLKKMELEYWTDEQKQFLKDNYQTKGDVEIAEIFQERFPKRKKWTKSHINKKRKYLQLQRTEKEIEDIIHKNCTPGGSQFTILENSSSLNLHDSWVAQQIAWRDKELQLHLLKHHPEIIQTGKELIRLKRTIKAALNDRS